VANDEDPEDAEEEGYCGERIDKVGDVPIISRIVSHLQLYADEKT
jgi:hypothetical protein